ncbi:hypothetical protein [Streptomyces sp. HPF1205]|uniref:hypothetical protein n=1 Tax=Streptomyces sp. HPF1205 TaxID=2873262 RepID=UPI001CED8413|nr:hypothetical protein [Streptomyces sp. HPF1205]
MRERLVRIAKAFSVAIAVATLALTTTTTAHATTYDLSRTLYLTGSPSNGGADPSMERSVTLQSGYYYWYMGVTPVGTIAVTQPLRDIYLTGGTYTWNCTLYNWDGYYTQGCYLNLPGHPTAAVTRGAFSISSGEYVMFSQLEPYLVVS